MGGEAETTNDWCMTEGSEICKVIKICNVVCIYNVGVGGHYFLFL